MLSSIKRIQVEAVCYATVGGMMATFCNPRYRGPNFQWDEFPEMMREMCRNQVDGAVIMKPEIRAHCLAYAEVFGMQISKGWVATLTG